MTVKAVTQFEDFFGVYEIPNRLLASVARFCHRAMLNTSPEQSSGMQTGMLPDAIARQRQYMILTRAQLTSINALPYADTPQSHPAKYRVDVSTMPSWFTNDNGTVVNMHTQEFAEWWAVLWNELLRCGSAGLSQSMHDFDYNRCMSILDDMEQQLATVETFAPVDLPETANPEFQVVGGGSGERAPIGGAKTRPRSQRGKQ